MADISGLLDGYHIQSDTIAGLELDRNVAKEVSILQKIHR
jgi:hypothetical protein